MIVYVAAKHCGERIMRDDVYPPWPGWGQYHCVKCGIQFHFNEFIREAHLPTAHGGMNLFGFRGQGGQ